MAGEIARARPENFDEAGRPIVRRPPPVARQVNDPVIRRPEKILGEVCYDCQLLVLWIAQREFCEEVGDDFGYRNAPRIADVGDVYRALYERAKAGLADVLDASSVRPFGLTLEKPEDWHPISQLAADLRRWERAYLGAIEPLAA